MSDPTGEHLQTSEEQALDSRLTERLLSRATRPLGVIDVRRAESHYARIMDWLAMRTPLLEHLKARYGLTEGEGLTGLSLAFADANASEATHAGDLGVNLSVGPDIFAPRDAEGLVTYVAHVPDDSAEQAEAKRITRRGVPTFSRAGSETQRPDAGVRQEPNEVARRQQRESVTTTPERVGSSLEQAGSNPERGGTNFELLRGGNAVTSVKEIPAATAESHDTRVADSPLTPRAAEVPHTPRASSTALHESTQSPVQRHVASAEGSATATTAEPDRALESSRGRRNPHSVVVPSVKEIPAAAATGNDTSASATPAHAAVSGIPAHAAAGVRETRMTVAPVEKSTSLARAKEIPADDSRRESPTLRAQSPLPLATNPAAAERGGSAGRQTDSAAAATQVTPVVAETITPGGKGFGSRDGRVNVERLTEQVSRNLARRLLVERERRGMSRR